MTAKLTGFNRSPFACQFVISIKNSGGDSERDRGREREKDREREREKEKEREREMHVAASMAAFEDSGV